MALLLVLTTAGAADAIQKWALLVGINEYRVERWKLKGCVNDVLMTKQLLIDKFGFPEANVKTLLDEEATADRIRQSLEEWLIVKSKPEDIVYFHFSGHGAQMNDTDGDEADGKDEFLCPVDFNPGNGKTRVTDDQLKELFARIPTKNVTIVTDCCHSGTGTRDISLNRKRTIDSIDLEHFALAEEANENTRAVVMTPAVGSSPPPEALSSPPPGAEVQPPPAEDQKIAQIGIDTADRLQVHISGCRDDQTAADAWIKKDFFAGALTYYWIENLRKAPSNLTYRDLIERVRRDLKAKKYRQLPQVNGAADRPMFGTELPAIATVPFVVVNSVQDGQVTLGAGRAQNVTVGSVYAVFSALETTFQGKGLGKVKVTGVQATTSQATVMDGATVKVDYRAKKLLHNQELEKLKLLVEGGTTATQNAVKVALSQYSFIETVEPGKHFHQRLQLSQEATGIQATLTIDGVPGKPVMAPDAVALASSLNSQLESSYAINYLSTLSNDNSPFGVEVWANKASPGTRDLVVEELEDSGDEKYMQAKLGNILRFHFTAEEDCYLVMINVGTSGKVNVLFPNKLHPDGRVQGGVEYKTRSYKGDPDAQIPLTIKLDPKGKAGREFVQVIASKTPINFNALKGKMGSQFVTAMTSQLAVAGGSGSENLLPTDQWATDFIYIETHR